MSPQTWTATAVLCLSLATGSHGAMFPPAMAPAPSPMAGSGNQSALFVVIATNATVTLNSDGKGSLMLTGLNPQVTWFNDKPYRRGGLLDASVFFGQNFTQNGKWIDNPNVALYASNSNPGPNDDNVITLTILSDPVYNSGAAPAEGVSGEVKAQSIEEGDNMPAMMQPNVTFPQVAVINKGAGDTVAGWWQDNAGMHQGGPTFINSTRAEQMKTINITNVAMFVDPFYCGCGPWGWCGCGWHSWW